MLGILFDEKTISFNNRLTFWLDFMILG